MAPVFSRKSFLFLALGVFVLLFGFANNVFATHNPASCLVGSPSWNGSNATGCDWNIEYTDPGGAGLSSCEYKLVNEGIDQNTVPWVSAIGGTCSGSGPVTLRTNDITIGSTGTCNINGEDACDLYWKASDNSGNVGQASVPLVSFDINYNTAPTISDIVNQTINEDANTGALAFTIGDAETAASSLTLTKDSSNTTLAPTANIVFGGSGANRTVTVTPAENQNGTATITVTVSDGSLTASDTFVLTVTAVNDAPTLNAIADPAAINEDAGLQTVNLIGISAGGGESQVLTVTAISATTSVIPNPTVAYTSANATGNLNYTPVVNASGSSLITVTVKDAGLDETAGNTDDGSTTRTFTVAVNSVNDAPSFTKGANQTVLENAGAQTIAGWAASISPGPPNESGQTVNFIVSNNNNGVFSIQPAISTSGTLTYNPAANANGSATVSVQIHDNGGTANGGADTSVAQTFTVTVADGQVPNIHAFDVTPKIPAWVNASTQNVIVSFEVSDAGGSSLKDVEVWRDDPDSTTLPKNQSGWGKIGMVPASQLTLETGSSTNYLGSYPDSAANLHDGKTYRYGIHVNDNAGNMRTENDNTPPDPYTGGPLSVQVDKTAPPKPTCSPAGGTFMNQANNVTCTDTEGGVTIRYSLDGSSPSILYSSPFDITSTATLKVAAWDSAGNRSATPDNSYSFTILHNQAPSIQGNPSDSPDPIKANAQITFSAGWNDPDGDSVTFFACKNNVTSSGGDCSGGSTNRWCRNLTAVPPGTDAACSYTTAVADAGTKNYYAFVCDDESVCSAISKSGTFLVDTQAPIITTFTITPQSPSWANNVSPSITVTWNVSDQGGAHLDKVRVYRALFDNIPNADGNRCDDANKLDCDWKQAGSDATAPNNSDNWNCGATCNDRIIDNPGSGTWWYGMHVSDKVGNCTREDGSACTASTGSTNLKKALVDKDQPTSEIQSPGKGSFQGNNFKINVADVDTGGSALNTAECKYSVQTCSTGPCNTVLADASRTCNANTPDISVANQCNVEGQNTCRVIVKSKDKAGNSNVLSEAQNSIRDFSIDLTWPKVDKVSCTGNLSTPCEQVQQSVSTLFRARVSDNIQLANCEFLWRPASGGSWQNMADPAFTPIPCQGGHSGDCLETFTNHIFNTAGIYDVRAQCWDSAFHTMPGDFVPVAVETLSVDLSAVPSSGSVNMLFDLTATVSGTMTGNINYKFDCTNDGTWELEVNSQTQNPYTAVDLCQYASLGTYTAKVLVERGIGTAEDTVSIPVSSNSIPSTTNLSVDPADPTDYLGVTGYPPVRVRWTFSDANPGDTQSAYELEVFQGTVKVVDTGKKLGATQSYVFQSAGEQLLWNTTYTWQVRVWDSQDDLSAFALGPQFTTPKHHYPVPNFTWTPALPGVQESVQFTDQTNFDEGGVNNSQPSINQSWSWNFADPDSGVNNTSILQNPSHTFTKTGAFGVTLQSTDDVGSGSALKTVNISIPFPEWQEISPF